jgi:hypothetical protein
VLAWLVILGSALLLPISVIAWLMVLAGSPGTHSSDPVGTLVVLAGPLLGLILGVGLLCRQPWALRGLLGVVFLVLGYQLWQFVQPARPAHTYVSPAGVPTTVLASQPVFALPIVLLCAGIAAVLMAPSVRADFARPIPGTAAGAGQSWRVGHQGRDAMYYEEWHDGAWRSLAIDGELLGGRAHHVIYFASPEEWQNYPEWARHRRAEIIARIQSVFRPPDYEYAGLAAGPEPGPAAAPPLLSKPQTSATKQRRDLLVSSLVVLALGVFMSWEAVSGWRTGETRFPSRYGSSHHQVVRSKEPVMFWTAIGIYGVLGLGLLGGAGCGFVWWLRETSR